VREPAEVSRSIAANVRRLRQERRLTLDAVAERGELSKGTLIQVEQERANPSIATLCRIADALGVGVATLIESPPAPRVVVRRRTEATPLWTSPQGSRAVFLVGTDPPDIVELWDWELAAGDAFDGEAHPPGTLELLAVIAGELTVTVDDEDHHLDVGDSVLFEGDVAHRYANPADVPTRFVMSVLQPTGGPLGGPETIAPAEG
jgi:transcriptional regulator with XRE-family HTH domain